MKSNVDGQVAKRCLQALVHVQNTTSVHYEQGLNYAHLCFGYDEKDKGIFGQRGSEEKVQMNQLSMGKVKRTQTSTVGVLFVFEFRHLFVSKFIMVVVISQVQPPMQGRMHLPRMGGWMDSQVCNPCKVHCSQCNVQAMSSCAPVAQGGSSSCSAFMCKPWLRRPPLCDTS